MEGNDLFWIKEHMGAGIDRCVQEQPMKRSKN
jgi:hypothetical protein